VSTSLQILLIILGIAAVLWGLSWIFIPLLSGLPWIPTHRKRIHKALELAALQPGEILYDLGSGDGRVIILAAREYDAKAIGIELSPAHCALAWLKIVLSGLIGQVSTRWGDFHKAALNEADVVFTYLTPSHALKLKSHLESQLRPGSRVITISADVEGWEPTAFDSEDLIFLYKMPPQKGSLGSFLMKRSSALPN
jgi:ubiquinone/menaquinone biosynthesis C-methylase UbiE